MTGWYSAPQSLAALRRRRRTERLAFVRAPEGVQGHIEHCVPGQQRLPSLAASHAVGERTRSHSLAAVDLTTLRAIDLEAHINPVLDTFRNDLKSRLGQVSGIDDVEAYSQAFEIYGEAVAYLHLRERVVLSLA